MGKFNSPQKKSPDRINDQGFSILMPGNDLLSHGETPHYHRRGSVSLLSSEWDQVGPKRYGCQANRLEGKLGVRALALTPIFLPNLNSVIKLMLHRYDAT
jgi:hypothetical protein